MKLVVDANIIMAILIKPGKTLELFYSDDFEYFVPEKLFKEIDKHIFTIVEKTGLTLEEISDVFRPIKMKLNIISEMEFMKCLEDAKQNCPDPNDIEYFALAKHLNCPIWSNDQKLKEQSKIKIFNTKEIIEMCSVTIYDLED